jgi:hypothetical protein
MKQFLSLLAFVVFGAFVATAQKPAATPAAPAQSGGPVMTLETITIDYGVIEKGADPIRIFKFTNTGNEPLIIKSAKGSCGCTVPTYPQEPIMPGEISKIEVRYDTQRVGNFTKTVTLTTNEGEATRTLTIKGEVKAPATQEAVPAGNGGLHGGK